MDTRTNMDSGLADIRLMQLVSPALPIGAFTYSQGLEYAVEAGWVSSEQHMEDWAIGQIGDTLAQFDLPILARLYRAHVAQDSNSFRAWAQYLCAGRETRELRAEESNRGKALCTLLVDLEVPGAVDNRETLDLCQAAGFALACVGWKIPLQQSALGYAWGWLENEIAAGIKLIPLGQTAGQRLQLHLSELLPAAVNTGLILEDDDIGASAPALAIASALHENQYTRLFRS